MTNRLMNDEQRETLRRMAGFAKDSEQDRNLRAVVEIIVGRHRAEAWDEGHREGWNAAREGVVPPTISNPYRK